MEEMIAIGTELVHLTEKDLEQGEIFYNFK